MNLADILQKVIDLVKDKYNIDLPDNTYLQKKEKGVVIGIKIECEYRGNYYKYIATMMTYDQSATAWMIKIDEIATEFGRKLQKGSEVRPVEII